jgi:hypothetical protein
MNHLIKNPRKKPRKKTVPSALLLIVMVLLYSAQVAARSTENKQDKAQVDFNVLFVGNSLTYGNNLPKLVKQHAASKGYTIETTMVAKGGYAIVDHWAEGRVQQLINTKQFDYVVIQQGPSSQLDGYEMLINGGAQYAALCEQNTTKLAYFMVWPSIAYFHTFDGVIRNYTAGAEANNATLIPVGTHWKEYIDSTGDYSYYGPDGFHPSKAGSEKAAAIIVETLFEENISECSQSTLAERFAKAKSNQLK